MEEMILHTLSNVGVPAAICFYTLIEVNKKIVLLTDAINNLSEKFKRIDDLQAEVRELKFQIFYGGKKNDTDSSI